MPSIWDRLKTKKEEETLKAAQTLDKAGARIDQLLQARKQEQSKLASTAGSMGTMPPARTQTSRGSTGIQPASQKMTGAGTMRSAQTTATTEPYRKISTYSTKDFKTQDGRSMIFPHGKYPDTRLQETAASRRQAMVTEADILKDPEKRKTYRLMQALTTPSNWDNTRGTASDYWALRQAGRYQATKPWMMSEEQLNEGIEQLQKDYDEAIAQEEAYRNKTPEDRAEEYQKYMDTAESARRYQVLASKGIPMMQRKNFEGRTLTWVADNQEDRDHATYYIKARPEDYEEYREDYDEYLYDAIHGNGAYERRLDALNTDRDADLLIYEMDWMWDSLENGQMSRFADLEQERQFSVMGNTIGYYGSDKKKRTLEALKKEKDRYSEVSQMMTDAPQNASSEYDPTKIKEDVLRGVFYGGLSFAENHAAGYLKDSPDAIYFLANNDVPEDSSMLRKYSKLRGANFMTPEQVETFNRYYNSGDKDAAMAFYDSLSPYLEQLKAGTEADYETTLSKNEYAPFMIGKRIVSAPVAGVMGTIGTGLALFGNEEAQNPLSDWYRLTRQNQNIQNARAEVWGDQLKAWFPNWEGAEKAGEFLNGVVYSIADNLVAVAAAGGGAGFAKGGSAEKIAEGLIQFIMSSEATAGTMLDQLESGKDPTEAALFSVGSGVIEAITEKYSIEALLKPNVKELLGNPAQLLKYLGKNTAAEASEEVASDVMGTMLDVVLSAAFNHENELMAEYEQIKAENPAMPDSEASRQVLTNYLGRLAESGLAGGLSGFLMSGTRAAETRVKVAAENTELGKKALAHGTGEAGAGGANGEGPTSKEIAAQEAVNEFRLVEAAEKMGPDTESGKKAKKIRDKFKAGKTVSKAEIGDMIRSIVGESNEQIGDIAKDVLNQSFRTQLKDAGVTGFVEETADALVGMIVDGNMTPRNMEILARVPEAQKILASYKTKDAFEKLNQATSGYREAQESVMELLADPKESGISESQAASMMEGAQAADENDRMVATGKSTGNANEVIADGKYGDVVGFERIRDEETGEMRLKVKTEDGRSTDIANVKGMTGETAQLLQFLQADQGRTIGNALGSVLMGIVNQVKKPAAAVADAMKIMWSAELGEAKPKTSISQTIADTILEAVQKDMDAAEAVRVENQREINPGQGKTTFRGVAFGTDAFNEALKKLTKAERNEAQAIGSIAQSAGLDVELYYDEEDTANQGSYSAGEGIRINLAGTSNAEGAHRSALATFAHEITHWIEGNSVGGYKALRTFVLSNLKKNGMNMQNELQNIMNTYAAHGQDIDLHDAVAEIVAKGSEQVLTSESAVTELKSQDPGLFGTIRDAVKRLVGRIRNARGDVLMSSSRYAKALTGVMGDLENLWINAFKESTGTVTETGTVAAGGRTEHSIQEDLDAQYAEAVKEKNWRVAERMLIEKAQATEGITGYAAPEFYQGEEAETAKALKVSDPEALKKATEEMAPKIPEDAVLIPMPPHTGSVTTDTDTYVLAESLSKATGAPVMIALESDAHTSRNVAKQTGDKSVTADTMGFRQIMEIPEGKMPIFIDNVVAGGQTAKAARNAIGRGITLAYAHSSRSKTPGVKSVMVTYDNDGNLIPLSRRMDPKNNSWKYSVQERDQAYDRAVQSGDTETMQRMVDEAAEAAMPTSKVRDKNGKLLKVYHGTGSDFTVFKREYIGSTGRFEGSGFNFTPYEGRASSYGKNVLTGYLNIQNPLSAERKTISVSRLAQLIREADPTGDNIISDYARETRDYGSASFVRREAMTAARNIWESSDNDVDIYSYISAADSDAEGLIAKFESLGYDGLIHYNDNGEIKTAVAFNSEQFKEADPVTYDDGKEPIKLSKRFNLKEPDIRYSIRDNDGNGSPQTTVKPVFNMDKALEVLNAYEGGANTLPTDHEIARQFAEEYKAEHPGRKQFSIQDETDYDARAWMETVPEWSLRTEAEKGLLRDYKSLRMKQQLDRERIRKAEAEIRRLEQLQTAGENRDETDGTPVRTVTVDEALQRLGIRMDGDRMMKNGTMIGTIRTGILNVYDQYRDIRKQLTESGAFEWDEKLRAWTAKAQNMDADSERDIRNRLDAQRIRLKNLQTVQEQTEDKLAEITGSEGFGGMMYRQNRVINDLIYNKTQAEVRDSVERMERSAERIRQTIDANRRAVEEMEKGGIVGKFKELLGTTTADQTAAELKKLYSSTWTKNEIRPYVDAIILKMKAGEDFTQDVETLAGILVNSDSRNRYEELEALRGLTITLGKGAQQELRAQNSSLRDVRARLAGTGITVKYGERSSLETDIEDLREEYPSIPDLGGEKDALNNFLDWIDGIKNQSAANEFYDQKIAEAMAVITGKAAGAAKGIYMPTDPKAQKQVLAMMDFVKGLNAQTAQAQKTLQQIADEMGEMQKAGKEASGKASVLMRDVNVALDYYSRIAKIAEDSAKQQRTSAVIEQLKSEQAQKILKNNEEWRALIERDRNARAQAEKNAAKRNQINTVIKRLYAMLKSPNAGKNVQEHMQGLARYMIERIVDNDLDGGRRLSRISRTDLEEAKRVLKAWNERDGEFDLGDLTAMEDSNYAISVITSDINALEDAITAYNGDIRGKNKLDTLQQRGEILQQIQSAVSEIYAFIKAENEIALGDRKVAVEDAAYDVVVGTESSRFKGERTGATRGMLNFLHKAIISGNMTPEYFFRTIGNEGMSNLWEEYHRAENRNGLELRKAQQRLKEIADKYGYGTWDQQKKTKIDLDGGSVEMTLGQIMSLWATWKREKTLGPEMSEHLTKGGFYVEQNLDKGFSGRERIQKRAVRVTEADMARIRDMLTDEQKDYVDDIVQFMSRDMSELGNEASMKAYGVKLYKEKYYFPFQMWDGVRNRRSNDAGQGAGGNQAFHPSFSKTRMHGANNALVLGDFTQTAADHIIGMINYATMGLANENLNKVLNQKTGDETGTQRNVRAIFEEAYGREALEYLMKLKVQLEGGAIAIEKGVYDRLISLFRKNAVAGSMSVAMQQPLSYIRAATMISPKYLAAALNPAMYKGSYKEMLAHSGVAVIKEMGRFDMNAGQSAREYLMPDEKEGKARKAWNWATDKMTILPELMDRMTWTRMWSACKAEMKAQHPEMNIRSDEFLDLVGERFNDLMRRTQVYDSVLVKSANMRNQNPAMKAITSFMAEPTLTANVLADAVRQAVHREKGGIKTAGKAGAIFLLSAILQAAVKAGWGTGRTPDKKKNGVENFLYRFWSNMLGEVDLLSLIPGYSTLIDAFKGSEITDNAYGALVKVITATQTGIDALLGNKSRGAYRDIEDSVGQLMQLFTQLPGKNLMRDGRAVYNWITGASEGSSPYAWRETSGSVIRNQSKDLFFTADNLIGVVNQYLGEAGFEITPDAYKRRVYEAMKAGDKKAETELIDYLLNGKGAKSEASILSDVTKYVKEDYKAGALQRSKAEELLKITRPKTTDKDVMKTLDEIDYERQTGQDVESYSNYLPLYDAMDSGDDREVTERRAYLMEHGYKEKDILSAMKSHIKERYTEGGISRTEAEALYRKYDPDMKAQDIAKALDEIEYEQRTGKDVENYSNYTPLYDAMDEGRSAEVTSEIARLKKLGYKAETIDDAIAKHIMNQYKAGDLNRSQAESRMKNYCKSMTANDVWWTFDRTDYNRTTGKDAGSGKYYRLWNAMDANNAGQIDKAIDGMTAHGVEKKNIKSQLAQHYKEDYLAAGSTEKVKIRDAMQKAYKKLGYKPEEADKAIANWTKKKKN